MTLKMIYIKKKKSKPVTIPLELHPKTSSHSMEKNLEKYLTPSVESYY